MRRLYGLTVALMLVVSLPVPVRAGAPVENVSGSTATAIEPLEYVLRYDPARAEQIEIELRLPNKQASDVFVMPRAVPMGYADVQYDRYVERLSALDDQGNALDVSKDRFGPRWSVDGSATTFRYAVDVDQMEAELLNSADSSKLRDTYLGVLGYSVFGYPEHFERGPIQLRVEGPESWPIFLTLSPQADPANGLAAATATDFYELADSQVIMGPGIAVQKFDAAVPVYVAQYAESPSDADMLGREAVKAMNALASYFGEVPFDHYTVHVEFMTPRSPGHDYGFSMEHMNSTTIFFDTGMTLGEGTENQLTRHLYNLSHHMAHSWIPKRAAAKGYFPWNWEFSPVLDSIWFSEGWGQYAAAVALAEGTDLGEGFTDRLVDFRFRDSVESSPNLLNDMPLVDVSRIASTRYSDDFRTGRNAFSRGGMMAYEMDNTIRKQSDGQHSLKDVIRRLFADGRDGPLDLDALPALVLEETGVDVSAIHQRWLQPLN